jgi:hypothetical protein
VAASLLDVDAPVQAPAIVAALEHGDDELLLGREALVETLQRDPGMVADVVHAGGLIQWLSRSPRSPLGTGTPLPFARTCTTRLRESDIFSGEALQAAEF